MATEMTKIVDALVQGAEEGTPPPDINSCMRAAVDVAEWMRIVRDKAVVQGSTYVPAVIKKQAKKAVEGDSYAARLLLEFLDMMPKKVGGGVIVPIQINLSPQELEEIKNEVIDV